MHALQRFLSHAPTAPRSLPPSPGRRFLPRTAPLQLRRFCHLQRPTSSDARNGGTTALNPSSSAPTAYPTTAGFKRGPRRRRTHRRSLYSDSKLYSAKDARPRAFATRAFTTAGGGDGDGEGINTATLDFIRRCNHAALRSADKHELRFFPPLREEEHLRGGGAEALKDAEPVETINVPRSSDDRFHTLSSGSSGISGDASITSSDPPPFGVNPSEWQDASDYGEDLVVRPYEPEIDFINERHIGNGAFADVSR